MRVVKLGGRTQSDPALPAALAELWKQSGRRLVVVHGGGDQISALQRMRGEEPVFIGGRRVTTDVALELVRMVLSGLANKQVVSALVAAGAPAVGISGEDAGLLRGTLIDAQLFGHSGTPSNVDPALLNALLNSGFLPVVSPVAALDQRESGSASGPTTASAMESASVPATVSATASNSGTACNVNGDDAAAAIAAALTAYELFLLADVPGVLDKDKQLIPRLTLEDARKLVEDGVAGGGMAAKLDACAAALAGGVSRVRIGDLAALTVPNAGTAIVAREVAADVVISR